MGRYPREKMSRDNVGGDSPRLLASLAEPHQKAQARRMTQEAGWTNSGSTGC